MVLSGDIVLPPVSLPELDVFVSALIILHHAGPSRVQNYFVLIFYHDVLLPFSKVLVCFFLQLAE